MKSRESLADETLAVEVAGRGLGGCVPENLSRTPGRNGSGPRKRPSPARTGERNVEMLKASRSS